MILQGLLHILPEITTVLGEYHQSFFDKYRHWECKYLGELIGATCLNHCLRDWVEATVWGYSLLPFDLFFAAHNNVPLFLH